jgi:hypothetical protein
MLPRNGPPHLPGVTNVGHGTMCRHQVVQRSLPVSTIAGTRSWRASTMRLRAQRREALPNMAASFRSDSSLPVSMLAR